MKIEIKSWITGGVLFAFETDSLRVAVEAAVKSRANLRGANLGGANLRGANLRGAKNAETARLDTGETLAHYIRDVMPALLTAGGKTVEEVAAAWDCHDWDNCDNCPMAIAFGVHSAEDTPVLLQPRVRQFVQLYDARLLPKPVTTVTA